MATTTSFYLQPPQNDDMDVSNSPTIQGDDDIEIDFDDSLTHNDEPMGDDGEERLTHVDDEMHDDTAAAPIVAAIDEDELIDYSDDEDVPPQSAVTEAVQPDEAAHAEPADEDAHYDGPILVFEEHDTLTGEEGDLAVGEAAAEPATNEEPTTELIEDAQQVENDLDHGEAEADGDDQHTEPVPHNDAQTIAQLEGHHDETSRDAALELDTAATAYIGSADAPGTPTDTGLHPVTIWYGEDSWPLFRSKNSPEGLLKDDNLVSVSLADFIQSCRQRLVIKLDEDIADHLELVLTFNSLNDLMVAEGSTASFNVCLKDVLDAYVQLQSNDGIEDHEIPALVMTATTQIKFNNSIAMLQHAAEASQGFSAVIPSAYQQEEYDDIQHDAPEEEDALDEAYGDDDGNGPEDAEEQYELDTDYYGEPDENADDQGHAVHDYAAEAAEHEGADDGDAAADATNGEVDEDAAQDLEARDSDVPADEPAEADYAAGPIADETNDATAELDIAAEVKDSSLVAVNTPARTEDAPVLNDRKPRAILPVEAIPESKESNGAVPIAIPDDELIDYSDDEEDYAIGTATIQTATKALTPTKRGRDPADDDDGTLVNKKPRPS